MSRVPRTETLLVLACAAGAAMLAGSQFTDMFQLTPPGGDALQTVDASDQHGYATLVLAVSALVMLIVGIGSRNEALSQIAAFAVAACGVVALLIFLVGDLPDANKIGTLDDARQSFVDAKAEPAAGFWFELIGSLILAVCGGALATLGPDSISMRRPGEGDAAGRSAPARRDPGHGHSPPPYSAPRRTREEEPGSSPLEKARGLLPGRSKRKRIGRPSQRPADQEATKPPDEGSGSGSGFDWPSREKRD